MAVMTMDADMILAPNFLAVVMARLERQPSALVFCHGFDLLASAAIPNRPEQLLATFERRNQRYPGRAVLVLLRCSWL